MKQPLYHRVSTLFWVLLSRQLRMPRIPATAFWGMSSFVYHRMTLPMLSAGKAHSSWAISSACSSLILSAPGRSDLALCISHTQTWLAVIDPIHDLHFLRGPRKPGHETQSIVGSSSFPSGGKRPRQGITAAGGGGWEEPNTTTEENKPLTPAPSQ